ncbi:unnamed protein product [Sphenostylis stenocarpa]|uniref:G-patch domain-containing protein n=1 Tax=Sphenostylis stenocarpa TaxID=92480 RepID=A0AA86SA27_9FABA|nr:unnamed protein product [Sphenostylis stenocarpa]
MKKISFSVPSANPQSKPKSIATQNDVDSTKYSITEFDPSKPATPSAPKVTIPPLQNHWKPSNNSSRLYRRTPAETQLLHKLKLQDDLQRLPEGRGFEDFEDVPVEGFGAAVLSGYGWTEGMGIGKNAKEDVKVAQFKGRTSRGGLGFVASSNNSDNFDRCSRDLCHLQL